MVVKPCHPHNHASRPLPRDDGALAAIERQVPPNHAKSGVASEVVEMDLTGLALQLRRQRRDRPPATVSGPAL